MSGIYDDTVFDEAPEDDLDEPEDGRYGTPEDGSSDNPETMNRIDPLRRHSYLVEDNLEEHDDADGDSENETLASQWELDDEEQTDQEDDED